MRGPYLAQFPRHVMSKGFEKKDFCRCRSDCPSTIQAQHTAAVSEMVESLVIGIGTCSFFILTASFVPAMPAIAACVLGVVAKRPQFACINPPCYLEGEAEASGASIHQSTRSIC